MFDLFIYILVPLTIFWPGANVYINPDQNIVYLPCPEYGNPLKMSQRIISIK